MDSVARLRWLRLLGDSVVSMMPTQLNLTAPRHRTLNGQRLASSSPWLRGVTPWREQGLALPPPCLVGVASSRSRLLFLAGEPKASREIFFGEARREVRRRIGPHGLLVFLWTLTK